MYAPIVISVYSRLQHLKRCIASLAACPQAIESDLFVVSDAPYREQDAEVIEKVRAYVRNVTGFRSVTLFAWEENQGALRSVARARQQIFERYDRLIFMEDDNVVSPHFLAYINEGLNRYRDNPKVHCICGYNHNMPAVQGYRYDAYFMYVFSAYGYGIWRDRFENLSARYEKPDFTEEKYRKFAAKMQQQGFFLKRMERLGAYWGDVRTTYYLHSNGMVSLSPVRSLVYNTGYDNSGLHCGNQKVHQQAIDKEFNPARFPQTTRIDAGWERNVQRYFAYPWWRRLKTRIYDWRQQRKRRK